MNKLLIGTGNAGKLKEMEAILDGLAFEVVGLNRFPPMEEPVEDADTFRGNAEIKARYYASKTNLMTLADDSGLVVDALGGAPGVHSARYAGVGAGAAANNKKLVDELGHLESGGRVDRSARFCCAIVVSDQEGHIAATAFAAWEGMIVDDPRGTNGFGYDPHFFLPDRGVTSAELPPSEKNRLSHRGQALRQIRDELARLVNPGG